MHALLALALLLVALLQATAARAAPLLVDHVTLAAGLHGSGTEDAAANWQPHALPDHWGISQRTGMWTYRMRLPASAEQGDMALWIPKAGDQVEVWVNGARVARFGDVAGGGQVYSLRPLWVPVPAPLLRVPVSGPALQDVRIVVAGAFGRVPGLARVWWGTPAELWPRHELRDRLVVGGAVAIAVLCSLFALASLVYAVRTGSGTAWLLVATSLLWVVRELLRMQTEPWPDRASWLVGQALAQGLTMTLCCWVLLRLMVVRAAPLRAVLGLLLALGPLIGLLVWQQGAELGELFKWLVATQLAGVVTACVALWAWARRPDLSRAILALGLWGCVVIGLHDNWRVFLSGDALGYEHVASTSYMAVFFLLAVSASVFVRIDRGLRLEARHKQALQAEVQAQRAELETLHQRESERLRLEAVAAERLRIMRDMHDGLGSHLVGLLSTVQSGHYSQAELTQEVRDAIDQLRLTIDTLEPIGHDLASLLGQLRFRLEARLKKLGIQVDWRVDELPGGERLGAQGLTNLQRLLYEVFSNIIKHAQASCISVRGHHNATDGVNEIVIADNGRGFDAQAANGGRGLHNMRLRAEQLGSQLRIEPNHPQGTLVALRLHCT